MESSHLNLAHDHARAASIATQTSDTTVAINEHALAAGEFAKAAIGISSEEALRTLKLLETHHQRLSELLKFPLQNPVKPSITDRDLISTSEKTVANSAAVSEVRSLKAESPLPRRTPPNTSILQVPRRMPPRESSSSIASNLASARGIRSANDRRALSPSVTNLQAPGSVESPLRRPSRQQSGPTPEQTSGRPSWVPPLQAPQKVELPAAANTDAAQGASSGNDEGFQRFYNTLENFLSRISAPLAFAGLPLVPEDEPSATPAVPAPKQPQKKPSSSNPTVAVEDDLSKYISRAALRASANRTPGTDSFYVVPSTGHTVSYANILSFAEKEKRRLAASMHSQDPDLFDDPDNEDFVDARETLVPSPSLTRTGAGKKLKSGKELENVVEELYMENKSLKDCIDQLSKRLHAFEMSAQSSSMALQESIRLMRPASPGTVSAGGPVLDTKLIARIKSLEEHLGAGEREIQRLGKENEKLKNVVLRYRERWEKLKEGAKTRREGGAKDQQPPGDAS